LLSLYGSDNREHDSGDDKNPTDQHQGYRKPTSSAPERMEQEREPNNEQTSANGNNELQR
jgi:hypothetical protein